MIKLHGSAVKEIGRLFQRFSLPLEIFVWTRRSFYESFTDFTKPS